MSLWRCHCVRFVDRQHIQHAQPQQPADEAFFELKIRPMLAEHCYKCHSARATKIKGGLRVDNRDGFAQGWAAWAKSATSTIWKARHM